VGVDVDIDVDVDVDVDVVVVVVNLDQTTACWRDAEKISIPTASSPLIPSTVQYSTPPPAATYLLNHLYLVPYRT
jgi:hypothetical protein